MITVNFPDLDQLVAFDGEVLEVSYGDDSKRIYKGDIESIQVDTDRKGNRTLHVKTIVGEIPYMPFDEQVSTKVDEFVAEVEKAMATFRFE
jgi:hypothetical protein